MRKKTLIVAGGVLLGGLAAAAWIISPEFVSTSWLAEQESLLRTAQRSRPIAAFCLALAVYLLISIIPGVSGKALVYGWLFGFWQGLVLVNVASTAAALAVFLFSRCYFKDLVWSRFGFRADWLSRKLDDQGPSFLFALRMVPVVPYFLVNALMGITPIRTSTYWWVTQLGILPGNCVVVYAGSTLPDLSHVLEHGASGIFTPQLIVAFVLLGVFPLLARRLAAAMRQRFHGRARCDVS